MSFTNSQIEDYSLPTLEDVHLKPISKHYFKIIVINKAILYGILFSILFTVNKFTDVEMLQNHFLLLFIVLFVFCLLDFVVSRLAFNKRKYAIREHDIIYAKGLFLTTITTVPISRIQHIEESRSWLARQFNLSTLNIFTAGESGSDLTIKGLPKDEAKQINDFLSSKVNGKI